MMTWTITLTLDELLDTTRHSNRLASGCRDSPRFSWRFPYNSCSCNQLSLKSYLYLDVCHKTDVGYHLKDICLFFVYARDFNCNHNM